MRAIGLIDTHIPLTSRATAVHDRAGGGDQDGNLMADGPR